MIRDIISKSIVLLGKQPIISIEDNRPEVQSALEILPLVLTEASSQDFWGFNVKRATLNQLSTVYQQGYISYGLPTQDFLYIIALIEPAPTENALYVLRYGVFLLKAEVDAETGVAPTVTIDYQAQINSSNKPDFISYCSYKMAAMLANTIQGNNNSDKDRFALKAEEILRTISANSDQRTASVRPQSDLWLAKF